MSTFNTLGVTFVSGLVIGFGISTLQEKYFKKLEEVQETSVKNKFSSYWQNMFHTSKNSNQCKNSSYSKEHTLASSEFDNDVAVAGLSSNSSGNNVEDSSSMFALHSDATRDNSDINVRLSHLTPFPVVLPPHVDDAETAQLLQKQFAHKCLQIAQFGLPSSSSSSEVRCYGAYVSGLNLERRIPNWVAELIDYSSTSTSNVSDEVASRTKSERKITEPTNKKGNNTNMNNKELSPSSSSFSSSLLQLFSLFQKPTSEQNRYQPTLQSVDSSKDSKNSKKKRLVVESESDDYDANNSFSNFGDSTSDSKDDKESEVSRVNSHFYADLTVPELFRVHPSEYTVHNGFSRGHLAAAQLHKESQNEMNATFNMNANIIPQDMTMNAMDWQRLEHLTHLIGKKVAEANGKVFVVSGPVFAPRWVMLRTRQSVNGRKMEEIEEVAPFTPHARMMVQYELTGKSGSGGDNLIKKHSLLRHFAPVNNSSTSSELKSSSSYSPEVEQNNNYEHHATHKEMEKEKVNSKSVLSAGTTPSVAIPTHLYKVIVTEQEAENNKSRKVYTAAAFIMPNGPIIHEEPLTSYQVPIDDVSKLTGLEFFPQLHVSQLPNMCKAFKCNTRTAPAFKVYRQVAQLRVAESIPELNQTFAKIKRDAELTSEATVTDAKSEGNGTTMSKMVIRELERKREELAHMAVGEVDDV